MENTRNYFIGVCFTTLYTNIFKNVRHVTSVCCFFRGYAQRMSGSLND